MTDPVLLHVDPATLLTDANIREQTSISQRFAASVARHGVLVPLDVVREHDGLRVRDGHRRTMAALRASLPTVPAVVREGIGTADEDGRRAATADRLVAQVVINQNREGLTPVDQVAAVSQLALLGVPLREQAKRMGEPRSVIEAAHLIASTPVAAAALTRSTVMTLDQAATIAEFADDPDTVERLVGAVSAGAGFDHTAQAARDARGRHAALLSAWEEARAEGHTPIDKMPRIIGAAKARPITALAGKRGAQLTPASHAKCPHAAVVITHGPADSLLWQYVCTDWDSAGHTLIGAPDPATLAPAGPDVPPLPEAPADLPAADVDTVAHDRAAEDERAWKSATTVRRAHLAQVLGRITAPKQTWQYVATELAAGELAVDGEKTRIAAATLAFGGVPDTGKAAARVLAKSADRHPHRPALAVLFAAIECEIRHTAGRAAWARYLRYLRDHCAYELADIETVVLARCESIEATSTLTA